MTYAKGKFLNLGGDMCRKKYSFKQSLQLWISSNERGQRKVLYKNNLYSEIELKK